MRDLRVQELRGVAVVLVVLLHALKAADYVPGSLADLLATDNFGALGVDLFFVISGMVMAGVMERSPSPGVFLRNRARRLLPMWWLTAAVFLALGLLFPTEINRDALLNTITLVPLFDRGRYDLPIPGVGWTLGFEAVFYLLVAFALAVPNRRARATVPLIMLAALGVAGLVLRPADPLAAHLCNPVLFEFLMGMLVARAAGTEWAKRIAPALVALAWMALVVPLLFGFQFATDQWTVVEGRTGPLREIVWGIPCAALLLGIVARPDRRQQRGVLTRLGDASYSIYLTHTLIILLSVDFWDWRTAAGRNLLAVMLVVGGIRTGLAVHHRIERPLLARAGDQTSAAASASTVSPRSFTSAKPPSTRMRAATVPASE